MIQRLKTIPLIITIIISCQSVYAQNNCIEILAERYRIEDTIHTEVYFNLYEHSQEVMIFKDSAYYFEIFTPGNSISFSSGNYQIYADKDSTIELRLTEDKDLTKALSEHLRSLYPGIRIGHVPRHYIRSFRAYETKHLLCGIHVYGVYEIENIGVYCLKKLMSEIDKKNIIQTFKIGYIMKE